MIKRRSSALAQVVGQYPPPHEMCKEPKKFCRGLPHGAHFDVAMDTEEEVFGSPSGSECDEVPRVRY